MTSGYDERCNLTENPLRILIVTTFFPNAVDRYRTVFVKNLVVAMHRRVTLGVVAPVPYAPPSPVVARWAALRRVPVEESIDGVDVVHPRFIVIPKFNVFSGLGYFIGVLRTLYSAKKRLGSLLLHVHCGYPDSVGVACAARLLRLPYVVTVHGSDINVYAAMRSLKPQIRWALGGARGVIAVSNDLVAKVTHLMNGSQINLTYIPCAGFDARIFFARSLLESRRALAISETARVVVFVGNLVPIKGVESLVDAWALLKQRGTLDPEDRLIVIGEGVCRVPLEQHGRSANILSNTSFVGAIPQAQVANWIAAANLLCLPSRKEGTPNVIVEALAMGVPVVASRVGGIPELVRDDVNGVLVEPGHAAQLADALDYTMSRTWQREEICASVAHLTWDALAEKNCEFLDAAVKDWSAN